MDNDIKGMDQVYKFVKKNLGLEKKEWDFYRNTLAYKESQGNTWFDMPQQYMKFYNIQGGSDKKYDGRYQMGSAAKTDGANKFGISNPGHSKKQRESFLQDPLIQEKIFAGYTVANMGYMNSNEKFKKMSTKDKFRHLTFAHNSGHGNAKKYINGDIITFRDGNGHDARNYIQDFDSNYRAHNADQSLFQEKQKPLKVKNALAGKNLFSLGEI